VYNRNETKKKISKKSLAFLISIFVVTVVLLTGLIMLLTKGKDIEDTLVSMPFSKDSNFFYVGQNIVYLNGADLTCKDTTLKTVWQCSLYTDGLKLVANDSVIAAIGNDAIQCVDARGGQLFTTRIDGSIQSARVGTNKVAVYVTQPFEDETPAYILIFNLAGENLYKIEVTNRYVLDYGFDSQSDQLYLLEIDVSGSVPVSRISTYRPETQAMTGIKELKDQLVDGVKIIDKSIYAMGTHRLTIYSSANTGQSREIMTYGWVAQDILTTSEPKFVYVPSSNSREFFDIARVIRSSGAETKINLPPQVFRILYVGEKIYCFTSSGFFVYTGEGKYLRTYSFPFEIDGVMRAMPGYVFITQSNAVYLMPLP
jgi:hypothetical protein